MDPGTADVVHARTQLGNAAVTAAMGGLPRGAEPKPSAWAGQMLLAGQNLVGNQAVASQATAPVAPTPAGLAPLPQAPVKPAPAPKKPPPAKPTGPKTEAPSAAAPDKKDLAKDKAPEERPDKEAKKEKAAAPRSPGADPKFQALKKDVNTKKKTVGASHPPAAAEAGAAQEAAEAPADDQEARGKAAHAEDMDAAKPKEFNKQEFIQAVKKAIAAKAPKNLDEADKFGGSGKAEEVKTEVQGKVGEGKDASAQEIAETTAAPPEPAPDAKQVVPMAGDKVPGKPGTPNPAQAAPDQLPPSATDMSAGPDQVNQQMTEAKVTEQQLTFENSREPQFDKAVKEKKSMEAHSEAAPKKLRADESRELNQVKKTAATQGSAAMAGIHGTRVATGQQVGTGKKGTKKTDEDKRKEVTDLLQKVFDQTKCDVEKILEDLDKKVDDQFTTKEKKARDRFTREHEEGMERYKDERYGGILGKGRWVRDLFAGLPEEANRIYERARDNYLAAMDQIITEIADTVEAELKRAKDRIAAGRKELKAAVDKLPADLRAIGREAATEFEGKFDELKDSVNEKGTELVDTLATKYTEAVKSVDEEIAKEKEKNKGLVAKAAAAIGGAIKAIIELGRMLLGVLRKAATAVSAILKDPIGFLGSLVKGVGGGLKLFMKNAGRHLQAGVLAWLLGIGATAGLQLPTSFDVLGILTLIAMILGLSWPNIRNRLSRRVPPQALAAAETSVPLVSQVKRRGVAGMWDDLKTRVGDLKKTLIKDLVSFLLPTIIIAGITWIVSLFNPASAFIRACKMIIDIIRFIVTNARQIIDFVNAVLDAVIAIAGGGTGGVPALVERALAKSIPVLIGALAALLGIGGIAGKVRQIFQKLARPVNRAIDWVINKIVGLIKKLWAKLKPKKKRPRRPVRDRTRPRRRRDPSRPRRRRPSRRRPDRRRDRRPDKAKKRSLAAALREANRLLNDKSATPDTVADGLPKIKRRHKLTSIKLEKVGEDTYLVRLAINPEDKTRPKKLSRDKFPYKISQAEGRMKIRKRETAIDNLHTIKLPFKKRDPLTGFVVNIPAIPDDVKKKPEVAARYLTVAWKDPDPDAKHLAKVRTAVVIGVNAFERLDPQQGQGELLAAMRLVQRPEGLLLAVFGFVWTPRWVRRDNGAEVNIAEVRKVYRGLADAHERSLAENNEKDLKNKRALPFGLFREEVLASPFTKKAVQILGKVNEQVHILTQDIDTEASLNGLGILAAYKRVLDQMGRHPLLTSGGYHFEGFQWKEGSDERTKQLTLLANELDRTIRAAIAKVHPQMLFPVEPNMLIKALDRRHLDGIFNRARQRGMSRAMREALDKVRALLRVRGGLYGIGAGEGRFLRNRLMEIFGPDFSMAYVGDVISVSTDPLPEDSRRGLTVTVERARETARGERLTEGGQLVARSAHAIYAMIMQSQSTASAVRLAGEFTRADRAWRALPEDVREIYQQRIQDEIFAHVEEVARLMADNPRLTAESPEIQRRTGQLRRAAAEIAADAARQGHPPATQAAQKAHQITEQIISALTADDFRAYWERLSPLLKGIMDEARPT